jgi:hypothetical protein
MNQSQPSRWEALTEAARRCVAEKQFDKAEEAFLAALREAEQFGDADPRVAVTLNALARVYHRRSKFFPAAALLHRLLGIKEREHGEEHPELAGILSNLAEMYARLGDARQELELRERALNIRVGSGEAEGGALEGLRSRITELKQKLEEEKARDEAARNAPRSRFPVPTGATDLPLIMPTPLASPLVSSSFAPAFTPAVKTESRPSTAPRAAMAAPARPRTAPQPVAPTAPPSAPQAATPIAPLAARADVLPTVRPTPSLRPLTGSSMVVEPGSVTPNPLGAVTTDPIGAVTPEVLRAVAPLAAEPLAPEVVPAPQWKPLVPEVVPAPQWTPIAPPAPVTSWPGERHDPEPEPEPDDYSGEFSSAPRRNWKPFAFGGAAVAAMAAAAVLLLSGPETSGSAAGDLAAQPAASVPEVEPPAPAITNPTEAQALEAGLANLQQEDQALPSDSRNGEPGSIDPAQNAGAQGATGVSNGDASRGSRVRVPIPSLSLDNVTKSIEAAARARVDSLTEAKDKQVYEYKGKDPRQ